jgi:hypothetical protein
MKQTAVEWLITEVKKFNTVITREYILMLLEQAKEMEKEQIENAYWEGGHDVPTHGRQCEQYYNETYKSE